MEEFKIAIAPEIMSDLRARLKMTRWPDQVKDSGWNYGVDISYLKQLVSYWLNNFDWKKQEEFLNKMPQFRTQIDGHTIHFAYVRSKEANPLPLIITHGWPSSFFETYKIIDMLTDPKRYGGNPDDAFDVIAPSLPGFGFSDRPITPGFLRVDNLWRNLMTHVLGYSHFVAHGTDIGASYERIGPISWGCRFRHSDCVCGSRLARSAS